MRRSMSEIVVIGSGVVGTATGKGFATAGHRVRFVDIAPRRIDALRAEGFDASDTITLPDTPAVIFLALPTPDVNRRYDLSALMDGTAAVGRALRDATALHTVVVRSTVPPGTCEHLVLPILEQHSHLRVDEGFALGSNPEFLRARTALEDFLFPWMTVVASRSRATVERLSTLLRPFGGQLKTFDDPAAAELVKCCHNIYNATKISFWNEMWLISEQLDIPVHDIAATVALSAEASVNTAYGIRGGSPYGGACLPKDTKGFLGFASDIGVRMPLLSAVVEVNDLMEQLVGGVGEDSRSFASAAAGMQLLQAAPALVPQHLAQRPARARKPLGLAPSLPRVLHARQGGELVHPAAVAVLHDHVAAAG
jgi:UDPglucose 6-dehydrogenase